MSKYKGIVHKMLVESGYWLTACGISETWTVIASTYWTNVNCSRCLETK